MSSFDINAEQSKTTPSPLPSLWDPGIRVWPSTLEPSPRVTVSWDQLTPASPTVNAHPFPSFSSPSLPPRRLPDCALPSFVHSRVAVGTLWVASPGAARWQGWTSRWMAEMCPGTLDIRDKIGEARVVFTLVLAPVASGYRGASFVRGSGGRCARRSPFRKGWGRRRGPPFPPLPWVSNPSAPGATTRPDPRGHEKRGGPPRSRPGPTSPQAFVHLRRPCHLSRSWRTMGVSVPLQPIPGCPPASRPFLETWASAPPASVWAETAATASVGRSSRKTDGLKGAGAEPLAAGRPSRRWSRAWGRGAGATTVLRRRLALGGGGLGFRRRRRGSST